MLTPARIVIAAIGIVLVGSLVQSGVLTPDETGAPGAAVPGTAAAHAVAWQTERVALTADDFRLEVNDLEFGDVLSPDLNSDPGSDAYRTLEVVWNEHEVEQRLNMYFGSDGTDWWVDEIRTYDGYERGEWVYAYGPFFQAPLGQAFEGDVNIKLRGQGRPGDPTAFIPAILSFHGLHLSVSPAESGPPRQGGKAGRDRAIPPKKAARLERALAAAIGDPLAGVSCHTSSEALDLTTSVFAELGLKIGSIGGGPASRDNECAVATMNEEGSITISTVVRPDVTAVLDDFRAYSLAQCMDATTAVDVLTERLRAVGHSDFIVATDGPLAVPFDQQEELQAHADAGCVSFSATGRDGDGRPVYYLYGA